jgi:hypothetical protein
LREDIALLHLYGKPRVEGQEISAPEQYSIQTLVAIRLPQDWRFTAFQNTLIQQERS